MSRRDTLVIAVLVNAGLLMVLFATATKGDKKKEEIAIKATPSTEIAIDEPLEQLAVTPTLTLVAAKEEEVELPKSAPVTVVPEAKPPEKELVSVTVKKGDFLEKIAKANNTSVAAIMRENNLSSTQLRVGQVLKVPSQAAAQAPPAPTPVKEPSASEYYVVKDGDNPWLIASKNHVRLDELLRINGLDEQSARRLRPGDRLKIR